MGIDVISLIIFLVCIVLFIWDKLPMATTGILGCVAMVIFGVCDFKTAFGQFASSTVILTIGVMIIGTSIAETGLAKTIGDWVIKVAKGSEVKLIIGTYLVSAFMSAFLTNSAVLAIFIPIIIGISQANTKIKSRNLIMPIAIACIIGGASTLVGSTQQMTAQGLLEESGLRMFKTFDFTLVGSIFLFVGLLYCLFIGRFRGEKIWGDRTDDDIEYVAGNIEETPNKYKKIIMAVIFILTVVFYITEWIPLAITSTSAALLCIITGCITQRKAVMSVNWNIVGRLAACLGLASALSAAGGTELISKGFIKIVGDNVNPFILYCLFVFLVQFVSNFMSNSTAILIVLPILISVSSALGLNTYVYALGITIASGVCLSCPLASSTLGMSMSAGYKFNDYLKYALPLEVVLYLLNIILVPLIYGLTV